eukprot:5135937-Pyramimonas_sp.AAC.1
MSAHAAPRCVGPPSRGVADAAGDGRPRCRAPGSRAWRDPGDACGCRACQQSRAPRGGSAR